MIDISNSRMIINKDLLNYIYEFEEKWIPKLDKMEYDDIIKWIATEGKSQSGSPNFNWAFLMHSYLVYFRMQDKWPEDAMWNVLSDVSFEYDFNDVKAFDSYINNIELYFKEGGSLWDFEDFKTFKGYPEID